ncbi:MAG: HAMP domain-containing histidine kinase [Phycisphaerae bacterium]|nr:HAMP domain-containing histidine kinase [Gemmatimonadaceae bacterium]
MNMNTPLSTRVMRVDYARQQMAAAIERVLFRISAEHAPGRNSSAVDTRTMLSVLTDSIVACTQGGTVHDFAPYAWTPEAPGLLSALRHELLCGRARAQWLDHDLLPVVTAIEQLSVALNGDVAVRFGEQFAGRDAQQRLVELAHDMRSPLSAILLLVERLQHGQNGPVTGAQQRHLALVYGAAFGLSGMANDLMDLARGGARLLGESPRAFSVADVLHKVRDVLQPLAEERGVSLRFSSPPADRRIGQVSAIHRVLLNLATNALKFTTVGSVTVQVQQEFEPDVLTFAVEDTGHGMPESAMTDIFGSRGATAHAPAKTINTDGLGLAICHKLLSAMQSELRAASRVDHGSRVSFSLRLPVAE